MAFIKYHKNAATNNGMNNERPIHRQNITARNVIKLCIFGYAFDVCVTLSQYHTQYDDNQYRDVYTNRNPCIVLIDVFDELCFVFQIPQCIYHQ